MNFRSSLFFAYRLIFPRTNINSTARKSVLGAMLCIGISLIPLFVVLSVSDGMISGMTSRIIGLSTGDLQAFVSRSSSHAESAQALSQYSKTFLSVDGVTQVYPMVESDGLATGKSYRTGARIRAVEPEIFIKNEDFSSLFELLDGDYVSFISDKKSAVIGQKMAELLNLKAGDKFRLITAKKNQDDSISPKLSSFKVAAVVSSGYQELDSLWVFVPLDTAFSVMPAQSSNYSVMIKSRDPFSKDLLEIQEKCDRLASGNGLVFNWKELNESQFENFSSTKVLLIFIMILIVLVAAINISSAIVMLVMERRREIAILKSLGGSNSGITLSFLLAGLTCGFTGLIIGLPLGLLLSVNANFLVRLIEKIVNFFAKYAFILTGGKVSEFSAIHLLDPAYYLTTIPVSIPVTEILIVSVSVIVLSFLVSLIPALHAGKEKPLDIFRKA